MDDVETVLCRCATLVQLSRERIANCRDETRADMKMMDTTWRTIHATIDMIHRSNRTMVSYGTLGRTDGTGKP